MKALCGCCPGISLQEAMKSGTRLSYKDVVCIATQILEIMLFLESVHVIHGNLDLKQFYYSDDKVMLSDL